MVSKKVLVTGCAGFIGSNLCEFLLKKGYFVVGIDNFNNYYSPKVKEFNINSFLHNPNFTLYKNSICDKQALKNIFKKELPNFVVHLAAWAGVTYSVKNPDIYIDVNVQGTNYLAQLSSKYNVKSFIFASSSSVYGGSKPPFKESADTSYPNSPYPASKKAAEVLLYTYSLNFKLPVTIFRFFNPLGPKLRPDMALPKLFRGVLYNQPFYLYQDPSSSSRDYTYIEDMLFAIEQVIKTPFTYEIFNLGNSNPVSLFDLINLVKKITNKPLQLKNNYLPGQMKQTFADITKANKKIGYMPKISIEQMVSIYYEWFLNQPDWYKRGDF